MQKYQFLPNYQQHTGIKVLINVLNSANGATDGFY